MTAVHSMRELEREARTVLRAQGYVTVMVSDCFRYSRYMAFNLTARKERDDGTVDIMMVKLKISLHPLASLNEAAVFCWDEIRRMKKFFNQVLPGVRCSRFEIWISSSVNTFQRFEITRNGIHEILSPDEKTGQQGSAA